jgi:hypothetical protein
MKIYLVAGIGFGPFTDFLVRGSESLFSADSVESEAVWLLIISVGHKSSVSKSDIGRQVTPASDPTLISL